ncbi:hypothetical protein ACQJBY_020761 [Aegilops geniculata]
MRLCLHGSIPTLVAPAQGGALGSACGARYAAVVHGTDTGVEASGSANRVAHPAAACRDGRGGDGRPCSSASPTSKDAVTGSVLTFFRDRPWCPTPYSRDVDSQGEDDDDAEDVEDLSSSTATTTHCTKIPASCPPFPLLGR